MNAQDVEITRMVRREFGRRHVDSTRLDVQVANGRVVLAGIITTLRDQRDVDLKNEVGLIMKALLRERKIRDVQEVLRLIQPEKEQVDTNTRGRTRPGRT